MTTYSLETQDTRPDWHRFKTIKNVLRLEITPKHYNFYTNIGTKIKLRTDTWYNPVELLEWIEL